MAKAMADADLFTWDEFRVYLIAAIECWEHSAHGAQGADEYSYYERFQVALECLLIDRDFIDDESLRARTQSYLAQPPGHDHGHSHE
jgi:nitrile hydratase